MFSDTDSESNSSVASGTLKKKNLKKETKLTTEVYDCNLAVASTSSHQPMRAVKTKNKKRGTHRWSSSSEDEDSWSSDRDGDLKEKRKV